MSTNHDLYLDLCAALAAGSIDANDRRVLEEHLDGGCAECLAFLRDLSGPIEALARSVPAVKPSRGLKARVMVAVAQSTARGAPSDGPRIAPPEGVSTRHALPAWAWAAAAAVLLLVGGVGWWRVGVLSDQVDNLSARGVAPKGGEPADLALRGYQNFLVGYPQSKRITLERLPEAPPGLTAEVAWDPVNRRAAVLVRGYGPPSPDLAFELWTIRDGKPYSEGVIKSGVVFIENVGDPARLSAFAVSVEGSTGAKDRKTPTKVALLGKTS